MVTLLSFIIEPPPGPIQLIITELGSTPLKVLTVQLITKRLPIAAFCMGPDGDMLTVKMGTVNRLIHIIKFN